MNILSLTAAQLGLAPAHRIEAPYPADSVLHGQLILAGCQHHVTAIQVTGVDGDWSPVHPDYTDEVEALYRMSGSDLTTAEINGKPYLFALFAHGS